MSSTSINPKCGLARQEPLDDMPADDRFDRQHQSPTGRLLPDPLGRIQIVEEEVMRRALDRPRGI